MSAWGSIPGRRGSGVPISTWGKHVPHDGDAVTLNLAVEAALAK
jgi:hypothetical protein